MTEDHSCNKNIESNFYIILHNLHFAYFVVRLHSHPENIVDFSQTEQK